MIRTSYSGSTQLVRRAFSGESVVRSLIPYQENSFEIGLLLLSFPNPFFLQEHNDPLNIILL
jgi:hypothetical protein